MAANFPAVGRSHDYQQPPPAIIAGTHAHAASKVWRGGPGTGACVNQGEERVGVAPLETRTLSPFDAHDVRRSRISHDLQLRSSSVSPKWLYGELQV
ncbi:unnamed protein product [Urochloa humidicola]